MSHWISTHSTVWERNQYCCPLSHFTSIRFQDSDILNLGTGSTSWFEVNGYGCVPTYPTNITSEDPYRFVRPESVDGCLLDYTTIEVVHSAVQLFFAVNGIYIYFNLIKNFRMLFFPRAWTFSGLSYFFYWEKKKNAGMFAQFYSINLNWI